MKINVEWKSKKKQQDRQTDGEQTNKITVFCSFCCCVLLLVQSELDNVDEHRAESDDYSSVVFLDPLCWRWGGKSGPFSAPCTSDCIPWCNSSMYQCLWIQSSDLDAGCRGWHQKLKTDSRCVRSLFNVHCREASGRPPSWPWGLLQCLASPPVAPIWEISTSITVFAAWWLGVSQWHFVLI